MIEGDIPHPGIDEEYFLKCHIMKYSIIEIIGR
jgi:hypothetical protein